MPFFDNYGTVPASGIGMRLEKNASKMHFEKLHSHFPDFKSLLEMGPGIGDFAEACTTQNIDYTCVDINLRLLKTFEIPGNKKVISFVPPIPITSNSFDITYAANLLEHMPDFIQASKLISEMERITKPGGLVGILVPDVMAWGIHFWNADYSHNFVTTKRRIAQLFMDNELKVEGIYSIAGPFTGIAANFASLTAKLIPTAIIDHGANTKSKFSKRIYSLKTTFIGSFIIIGRKP